MRNLPEVISDIFTYHGAALEKTGENRMEFLLPEALSQTIGLPEYGNLDFSPSGSCEGAIRASYDSELLNLIERLFLRKGKLSTAVCSSYEPNIQKISKRIKERTAFSNAVFRLNKAEKRRIRYLLFYFKYTALSDERREGMLSFLMNEMNRATTLIPRNDRNEIWEKLAAPEIKPEVSGNKEPLPAFQSACSAAAVITGGKLADFVKSLERRLNLDIRKGYEYYETLKEETRKAIEKKARLESRKAEEITEGKKPRNDKNGTVKEADRLQKKLAAIAAEQKWKIQDLIAKYSLNIQIEPLSIVQIEAASVVFWIDLKRRLSSRKFPLTYNPLTRKIDPLPCESCFYPRGAYYVCDEKLHIICSSCFKECSRCGKRYCSGCHKNRCPKCKNQD